MLWPWQELAPDIQNPRPRNFNLEMYRTYVWNLFAQQLIVKQAHADVFSLFFREKKRGVPVLVPDTQTQSG